VACPGNKGPPFARHLRTARFDCSLALTRLRTRAWASHELRSRGVGRVHGCCTAHCTWNLELGITGHAGPHCTVLHCTVLYCTALHCTALHCTAAAHPLQTGVGAAAAAQQQAGRAGQEGRTELLRLRHSRSSLRWRRFRSRSAALSRSRRSSSSGVSGSSLRWRRFRSRYPSAPVSTRQRLARSTNVQPQGVSKTRPAPAPLLPRCTTATPRQRCNVQPQGVSKTWVMCLARQPPAASRPGEHETR
jgi:hypothetical protein